MAGETSNTEIMAKYVSEELFSFFRWDKADLMDENFPCCKPLNHSKHETHTHPVDVVFSYSDPYLNRMVFLNTDLKSYKKGSIRQSNVRSALKSLAYTIECARVSPIWKGRYTLSENASPDVRGMLFVYNHDGEYDNKFYNFITPDEDDKDASSINTDSLPIKKKQYLHILDPMAINYLTTVVNDVMRLHHDRSFPQDDYSFFYPELTLHKTHGKAHTRAATIELLTAPYLIIKHDEVMKYNEQTKVVEKCYDSGYVIYYNRPGNDHREFIYFFDMISRFQILDSGEKIRLRVACSERHSEIRANFEKAIVAYSQAWGFDDYKINLLKDIEFVLIDTWSKVFNTINVGWEK
ncbi:hypothetical protein [Vreelandella arctica]|uniref:hypothetical protein n=1 Tax=Vreelandella arctica TaxID=3126499 RepID=UPI00300DE3B8